MARTVPSEHWRPDAPETPPLGYVWVPDTHTPERAETAPYCRGVIRVAKECRTCHEWFDGWMFLAEWEKDYKGKTPPESPYFVGRAGDCNPCIDVWEAKLKRKELVAKLERARADARMAKTENQRIATVSKVWALVRKLMHVEPEGSHDWNRYKSEADNLEQWMRERRAKAREKAAPV